MIQCLPRINELAQLAKTRTLTATEQQERQALRQQYLRIIRGQVDTLMLGITIEDEAGRNITPRNLYYMQKAHQLV